MVKVWVNGHGWIMGGNDKNGYRFTRAKAGAKPFTADKCDYRSDLYRVCKYVESVMQCNYDIVNCNPV